ncbi:MAG: L-lactate dehydrogenase [Helicobacteraceae bacterium]|jgi:L-lactate dehydrogenase|nr:L-lactate dehydrogenase [Helicobacteraceae bacterium]
MKKNDEYFKVAIIGAGKVGMTAAYALLLAGGCHEIALYGRDKGKMLGEKLDLEHAMALSHKTKISISDNLAELSGVDVFIFCAGAAQERGETRLQLAEKNIKIVDSLVPKLLEASPDALLLMVTNPVDLLTLRAGEIGGVDSKRVFGSGTLLDTARFRFHLSEFLPVHPRSIHAYVLGEHGDHSFPVISSANIGGQPLISFPEFSRKKALEAYRKARDAAYSIIESKGATYYGIGASITKIIRSVITNGQSVLSLSATIDEYYSQSGMAISVPCILGRNGIERVIKVSLDNEEQAQLAAGVATLKEVYYASRPK